MKDKNNIIAGLVALVISLVFAFLFNTHRAFYFFIILLILYTYLKLQFDLYNIMDKLEKVPKRKRK